MSKANGRQSPPQTSTTPKAARPENSKVERTETTYTTMKATYGFLFMKTQFESMNGRLEPKKSPIFIELKRGIEFFPERFLATFKGEGWGAGEALKHLDELRKDLARRASPNGLIREWIHRPRPQSQIELENELREAYQNLDSTFATVDTHAKAIEVLRAQLVAAGKTPEA